MALQQLVLDLNAAVLQLDSLVSGDSAAGRTLALGYPGTDTTSAVPTSSFGDSGGVRLLPLRTATSACGTASYSMRRHLLQALAEAFATTTTVPGARSSAAAAGEQPIVVPETLQLQEPRRQQLDQLQEQPPPLQQKRQLGDAGREDHRATCTAPGCRRCAYEEKLARQQQPQASWPVQPRRGTSSSFEPPSFPLIISPL